jgi:site-specific DNA-methyltransferase (adenine-specific)
VSLYYQDDFVTLYYGDCLAEHREWLKADVLVTDPPYGMAYESNRNRDKRNVKLGRPVAGDKDASLRDAVIEAWAGHPAIVFGRWNIPRPAATRTRLIWDKRVQGMGDVSLPWGPAEEEIYVLGKGFVGERVSNVLSIAMLNSADRERPNHPTPKPVPLMERLIEKCPPGVIADPFAGSGATLVAAKNLGRKVIGVELEERYCEIIAKRCAQDLLELEWTA